MNKTISNLDVKKVFDSTREACKRASTIERSLNPDLSKDALLVLALQKTSTTYGINITSKFQAAYEAKNAALSFLFAQVSNYILEKTFHIGSCQLQADVALFEFCKKGIFNISLICSNPLDELTQHWYLLILDDNAFNASSYGPKVYTAIEPNGFTKTSLYFDTWSNQLCEWKDFTPDVDNKYLRDLKKLKQAMFRPFIHLFKNEISLLENIIWCLTEYEKRLKSLNLNAERIPSAYTKFFGSAEDAFQTEVRFLFDSQQCMSQLINTIENEKNEFQNRLTTLINQNDIQLNNLTGTFFQEKVPAKWKEYPQQLVSQSSIYAGHQIKFFTLQQSDATTQQQADDFVKHLKENGFSAERRGANGKPSIIVDLTASSLTRQ